MPHQSTDKSVSGKPFVTVILPTNGRADYLREAIASVRKQSFTDFVVLVGDNGASDTCESMVQEIADPRFQYIRHASNLGAQGNWLELVRRASSPLVATLHDDDVWHDDFLHSLVPPMLADESVAMCFGDFNLIDCSGNFLPEQTRELSHQTHRDVLPGGRMQLSLEDGLRLIAVWNAPNPAICAVLRRQQVLDTHFPDQSAPLYDLWLDYQLVKKGTPLFYVPAKLTDYRIHPASATSAGFGIPEDFIFNTILAENSSTGKVLDEIRSYWAHIRWGRAVRKMPLPEFKSYTQQELLAASSFHPNPAKRIVAWLAGRSDIAWSMLRLAQRLKPKKKLSTA